MRNFILIIFISFCCQLKAQYCIPAYNPDPAIFIHNFNLGDIINRNSFADSATAYTFYQDITSILEIGRTYPITASGESDAGIKGDWALWIDYNNDGTFAMDERVYYVLDTRSTAGMLEIPNDPSIIGERRIRLSYVWTSQDLEPCGDYSNGESEDYIVKFVDDTVPIDYYCMPFDALNTDQFIIDTFSFGNMENLSSGSNEYNFSNYLETDFMGEYILGYTYDYMVSKDILDNISGGFIAWIDYDDNQIFDSTEVIFQDGPNIYSAQGTVTIPADSSFLGQRKLRIRSGWNSSFPLDACIFDSGTETEDYMINIITEPVSVIDLAKPIEISIFPNPCNEYLHVKNKNQEYYDFTIYNILGQVEKIGQINQQNIYPINVQQLITGMYILKVQQGQTERQIKFFKN